MIVSTFANRSQLWWYGLFLITLGLLLWIVAVLDPLTVPVMNILTTSNLGTLGPIGLQSFRFALGFGAAVTMGWGWAVMAASLQFTRQIRTYLLAGMIVWYVLDSISSYLTHFYPNIFTNTLLLATSVYVFYVTPITN